MGQLVDGKWTTGNINKAEANGQYKRVSSSYRNWIGESPFETARGRYHLFVNAGCPWAHRTILYRSLKGLTDVVTISFTLPAAGSEGWAFNGKDSLLDVSHLHQVYSLADSNYTGRSTVPILWDKKTSTIVNNESADIIRMFNTCFNALSGVSQVDYYPKPLRKEIDAINHIIYRDINNGVYRCGFARSQEAYQDAYESLFLCLNEMEQRLANNRFLLGDSITEADWRLFTTLARFDIAYYSGFRCNQNRLTEFTNLWAYTRDLMQQPEVAKTVDFAAIKQMYFASVAPGIIPLGPNIDFFAPSNRAKLVSDKV